MANEIAADGAWYKDTEDEARFGSGMPSSRRYAGPCSPSARCIENNPPPPPPQHGPLLFPPNTILMDGHGWPAAAAAAHAERPYVRCRERASGTEVSGSTKASGSGRVPVVVAEGGWHDARLHRCPQRVRLLASRHLLLPFP